MLICLLLVALERNNVLTSILRSGSSSRNGSNHFMQIKWAMALALGAILVSTAAAKDIVVQPEHAAAQRTIARNFMVASAHPLATEAGHAVLAAGGSAADAAVAVQVILALVEPQSSGLGGGGFLLYWNVAERALTTFDARERAPLAANERYWLGEDGTPVEFWEAVIGGRSVGVPARDRQGRGRLPRF
jgi:gamma-glutamyltranspeptidase/glutathione hydrolase